MSKLAVMPLEDYQNACDQVRASLGSSQKIISSELANNILEACGNEYAKGYADGQAEAGGGGIDYDLFWDTYQENGNRINYQNAFSVAWNDDIYNPKYPIVCRGQYINATSLFAGSSITDTKVPITISGSNVRADTMFQGCTQLKRIPSLTFDGFARFSNTFSNCKALEEINVYGVIDVSGMDVSASTKLTHDSLMSIINALKDVSNESTVYKLILGSTNIEKLSLEEQTIAQNKGWTLS